MWRPNPAKLEIQARAERLHDLAVAAARTPIFYESLGAQDTPEGRFELLSLVVILLIERLRVEGQAGASQGQALFDVFISRLDGAMREMGVSDISMARRMKGLGQAFYGRAKAVREALAELPRTDRLAALLARTAFPGETQEPNAATPRIVALWSGLEAVPGEAVLAGVFAWDLP